MPKVSVIMSVFNTEKYLKEAIDSVLSQTFSDFEFIIVNDGSSDSSCKILQSFTDGRIRVISHVVNKGLSKCLNEAIHLARGEYIARMDADDICFPTRFEKQIGFLESYKEYAAVGSFAVIIDKDSKHLYCQQKPVLWSEIQHFLPESPFFHSAAMFRKELFYRVGGYNEQVVQYIEDKIFWNQMSRFGALYNIPESLIYYRIVPSSITMQKGAHQKMNLIFEQVLNNRPLEETDISYLKKLKTKVSGRKKMSLYHLRIGKIYLEKKRDRFASAKHLFLSLVYYPTSNALFNILLSAMPYTTIYKWKTKRGAM